MSLLLLFRAYGVVPGVIDTRRYSKHPVNCIMMGTEPLSNAKKKVTEWNIPAPNTRETAKAQKSAVGKLQLPAMRRLSRSGWQ